MNTRFAATFVTLILALSTAACAPRVRDTNTAARDSVGALIGGGIGAIAGRGNPVAIATGAVAGAVVTDYFTNPSPPYVQPGANQGYDYDDDIVIDTGYQYYTGNGGYYRRNQYTNYWSVWWNGRWNTERPYGPPQEQLQPYHPRHHRHDGGPRQYPPQWQPPRQPPQQWSPPPAAPNDNRPGWQQRPYPSAPVQPPVATPTRPQAPATPAAPPQAAPARPTPAPAAVPPAPVRPQPGVQPLFGPRNPPPAPAASSGPAPDARQRVRIIDPTNVPPHAKGQ